MRPCPKCKSLNKVEAETCWYCKGRLEKGTAVRSAMASAPPASGPRPFEVIDVPEVKDTSQPWEVWIVVVLLAISAAFSVAAGRMVGAGLGVIIILGLFRRSNVTWWIVTGLNLLGALIYASFAVQGAREAWLPTLISGGVVGLLISCRVRHAY